MLATVPSHTSDDATWAKIETAFRIWSFHQYHEKTYRDQMDMALRFALAIVASSQPIKNREKVLEWYEKHECSTLRKTHKRYAASVPATGECGITAGAHGVSPFPPAVGLTAGGGIIQTEDRQ